MRFRLTVFGREVFAIECNQEAKGEDYPVQPEMGGGAGHNLDRGYDSTDEPHVRGFGFSHIGAR